MDQYQPQPAWISTSSVDGQLRERAFIRSVYAWMFGGMLVTAFASLWVLVSPSMQRIVMNPGSRMVLLFAEIGIVIFLSARITKMSAGAAAGAFLVYSLLNGLVLSAIFFAYTYGSIFQAFLVAGGMFGAMSVYGLVTKKDLTSWGSFFFMGLIGIVICSVVNIFLHSSGLTFVISAVGVFVFLGLTAWDNQKLKALAVAAGPQENFAIIGALTLYLDFINLFLMLLSLFGSRRR